MKAAVTIDPVKLALSVPVAAITDPVAEVGLRTWIARLRTDRVAIFRASVSKTSNAAVVVEDLEAVIDLGVAGLAEGTALVDSAVAAGVDGNN